MKKLFFIGLILFFAINAKAKILVVFCTPPASDVVTETERTLSMFDLIYDGLGFDYDLAIASNTSDVETRAQSGNYTMAIFLNLPEFDGGLKTDAHCLDKGLGKFGKWIGKSDVTFPIPIFVPLPKRAYHIGSIFTDSTGVSTTATCCTFNNPVTNAAGDSLEMSTHPESRHEAYLDIQTQTHVTPLFWRSDSTLSSVTVPSYLWKYVKDNGNSVYIANYGGDSYQAYSWITVISLYEHITPIDVPFVVDRWGYDGGGDLSQMSGLVNFCINNEMKADFFVDETSHDNYSFAKQLSSTITAHPELFKLTPETRYSPKDNFDWLGYLLTRDSDSRRDAIDKAHDSISVDYHVGSRTDTTRVFGYSGYYGGRATGTWQFHTILGDLHYCGIRDIYCIGHEYIPLPPGEEPYSNELTLSMNMRFPMEKTNVMRFTSISDGPVSSIRGGSELTTINRTTITNQCAVMWLGGMYTDGQRNTKLITTSGYAIKALYNGSHSFGVRIRAASFDSVTTYGDGSHSNALWLVQNIYNIMKFFNNIAADHTQTGIIPFQGSFLNEVRIDRRTGKRYPNSHVNWE